jgi:hypothetical protein
MIPAAAAINGLISYRIMTYGIRLRRDLASGGPPVRRLPPRRHNGRTSGRVGNPAALRASQPVVALIP